MTNKEKIEAFADDYTAAVIDFYRSKRSDGITPTNSEILAACRIPTDLGNVESEAFFIIVTVTQLVDADMNTAPKADNTVKSSPEWGRRMARLSEIETNIKNAERQARIAQLRADNAAAERQKLLDTKMAEHRAQSQARQTVKAERARLDRDMAVRETAAMLSYPRPQG